VLVIFIEDTKAKTTFEKTTSEHGVSGILLFPTEHTYIHYSITTGRHYRYLMFVNRLSLSSDAMYIKICRVQWQKSENRLEEETMGSSLLIGVPGLILHCIVKDFFSLIQKNI